MGEPSEWAIPGNWPDGWHRPVVRTVSGRIPPMPDDNDEEATDE